MKALLLPLAIVITWILLIVGLSTSFGSWSHSQSLILAVLDQILPALTENLSTDTLVQINGLLRKLAHFSEYAILFSLVYWLFRKGFTLSKAIALPLVLLCVVLFAMSDEVHQAFVPGRSPQVRDVLIDSLGATTIALVVLKFDRPVASSLSASPEERS